MRAPTMYAFGEGASDAGAWADMKSAPTDTPQVFDSEKSHSVSKKSFRHAEAAGETPAAFCIYIIH